MEIFVWIVHVLAAIALIGIILLQHGKGADMGAAFGSGSSGSLFGASGSANFLSRTTAVLATVFFLTSLGLTYFSAQSSAPTGLMDAHTPPAQPSAPASAPVIPGAGGESSSPGNTGSKAGEIPN